MTPFVFFGFELRPPARGARPASRALPLLALRRHVLVALLAGLVVLLCLPSAKANGLLTASNQSQLEVWLGQGPLTFTNVFTKTAGDGKTGLCVMRRSDLTTTGYFAGTSTQ